MKEKIRCPECFEPTEVGLDGDLTGDHYKLSCPVVLLELAMRSGQAESIDCPHMRKARAAAILKLRQRAAR